jgi:hypothetical protein
MKNRKSQKNKIRLSFFCILLTCALLAIAATITSRRANLLVRAHRIADTTGWEERSDIRPLGFGHYWLSSNEILYARDRPRIEDGIDLYLYNTHFDTSAKLTDFTKRMDLVQTTHGVIVSPDGKYLVAIGFKGLTADIVGIASKLRYPLRDCTCQWSWSADSRHLVHLTSPEPPNYTLAPDTQPLQFITINANDSVSISNRLWKAGAEYSVLGGMKASRKGIADKISLLASGLARSVRDLPQPPP